MATWLALERMRRGEPGTWADTCTEQVLMGFWAVLLSFCIPWSPFSPAVRIHMLFVVKTSFWFFPFTFKSDVNIG